MKAANLQKVCNIEHEMRVLLSKHKQLSDLRNQENTYIGTMKIVGRYREKELNRNDFHEIDMSLDKDDLFEIIDLRIKQLSTQIDKLKAELEELGLEF